jgi:predicted transcriptional regulator of viral defense system
VGRALLKKTFQSKDADAEILYQYAEKLQHNAVFKRLGFIAERFAQCPESLVEKIHSNIKTGIIKLDPHGPNAGLIITKWGIRVNIPWGDVT